MDKVIIFGCGPTGLRTYEELKKDNEIVAFFDNDQEKTGSVIEGITVYAPEKKVLSQFYYDYIVIASVYGRWQIKEQLCALGVPDEKVRLYSGQPDILKPFLKNLSEDFQEENISGACAEIGVFRGGQCL